MRALGSKVGNQHVLVTALLFAAMTCLVCGPWASAAPPGPTYWQDVRPVLRKNCTACHNAKNLAEPEVSGGLALDSYKAIRDSGKKPIVLAGKADASLL